MDGCQIPGDGERRSESKKSLQAAIEKVNVALLRLIKKHEREFGEIALQVASTVDTGMNLAEVELDGYQYMLMKLPVAELNSLTHRQREIALYVAEGRTNKEVGERLTISPATVAAHLRVIYRKLRVDSRPALLLRLFSTHGHLTS